MNKKINLKNRSFLKLFDFNSDEIEYLIKLSSDLKKAKYEKKEEKKLVDKNIALIFEKSSTRTRCAFEVAAFDQGANVTYLESSGAHLGKKETVEDTARVLGRMYDGIEFRGFDHDNVEKLAEYAKVPVWNGLTDTFHPTQALADVLTMMEHSSKPLNKIKFAYIGDARNNVSNSLLVISSKLGMNFAAIAHRSLQPDKKIVEEAEKIAKKTNGKFVISDDVKNVEGCDFIYTDVWVSLGEPYETWEKRINLLKPYRIDKKLMELTGNSNAKFMHCLPAFHNRNTIIGEEIYEKFGLDGIEVTEEVFESEASIVFDQAENRLHTIKAVMVATLE
jgi:ornithine carbamoyltransferase